MIGTIFIFSCAQKNTIVTICNRYTNIIDSIYFPHNSKSYSFFLKNGEEKKIEVDVSNLSPGQDGVLAAYIFRNSKKVIASFNYDEMGLEKEPPGSHIYLFENGYQNIDRNLVEPNEFYIYIDNKSEKQIDSITVWAKKISPFIDQKGGISIKVPYAKFKEKPELIIYQAGIKCLIKINHDWDNWNYNQTLYTFEKNHYKK